MAIFFFTFGLQNLICYYGGQFVRCVPLTWSQNGYCLAMGMGCLLWRIIVVKVLKVEWFECLVSKPVKKVEPPTLAEKMGASLRKLT